MFTFKMFIINAIYTIRETLSAKLFDYLVNNFTYNEGMVAKLIYKLVNIIDPTDDTSDDAYELYLDLEYDEE